MGVRKYMSSISCRTSAKNEIDELKPDGMSYADFVEELISAYKRDEGEVISPERLVEQIKQQMQQLQSQKDQLEEQLDEMSDVAEMIGEEVESFEPDQG